MCYVMYEVDASNGSLCLTVVAKILASRMGKTTSAEHFAFKKVSHLYLINTNYYHFYIFMSYQHRTSDRKTIYSFQRKQKLSTFEKNSSKICPLCSVETSQLKSRYSSKWDCSLSDSILDLGWFSLECVYLCLNAYAHVRVCVREREKLFIKSEFVFSRFSQPIWLIAFCYFKTVSTFWEEGLGSHDYARPNWLRKFIIEPSPS